MKQRRRGQPQKSSETRGGTTTPTAESGRTGNDHADRLLLVLLDEAKALLATVGIRLGVVSIDEERVVLVSEPANDQVSVDVACQLSRRVLTQIAKTVRGGQTELTEVRCGRQSAWPCTFSLEWSKEQPAAVASSSTMVPSLEMLITGYEHDLGGGHEAPAVVPVSATSVVDGENGTIRSAGDGPGQPTPSPLVRQGQLETAYRRPRRLVPPWFKRRWWLLMLFVLAGVACGYFVRSSHNPVYSADAEVVVATGAGRSGPGEASNAIALARTDASILPSDQALLRAVGRDLRMSPASVARHLSASAQPGTSVVNVSFRSSTPAAAVRGADAVARSVTTKDQANPAIPKGSLDLVDDAGAASATGFLRTYGIGLGALIGLLLGLLLIFMVERLDPRADGVDDLSEAVGTEASEYPGPASLAELEQVISRASAGALAVTLVPLSDGEMPQAVALRDGLASCADQPGAFGVAGPVGSPGAPLARGMGPTVLVVKTNAKLRAVRETAQRLEQLGRRPVWSVLAVGRVPSGPVR